MLVEKEPHPKLTSHRTTLLRFSENPHPLTPSPFHGRGGTNSFFEGERYCRFKKVSSPEPAFRGGNQYKDKIYPLSTLTMQFIRMVVLADHMPVDVRFDAPEVIREPAEF